jgi:hypothetical protein
MKDLRACDQALCAAQWRTIKSIAAYRAHWLTEAQGAKSGPRGAAIRTPR